MQAAAFGLASLFLFAAAPPALANEGPRAALAGENTVVFTGVQTLAVGEGLSLNVVDADGSLATISVEKAAPALAAPHAAGPLAASASERFKVSYVSGVINCGFYMTVANNSVQDVSDDWITLVGGSYTSRSLSKTSSYGLLSFKANFLNIVKPECWLKGTVTGSNNQIQITYQM